MVAKVDQEEVLAPIQREVRAITAVLALSMLAAMLGVGVLWHRRRLGFARRELAEHDQLFAKLGAKRPPALAAERRRLGGRIGV